MCQRVNFDSSNLHRINNHVNNKLTNNCLVQIVHKASLNHWEYLNEKKMVLNGII